MLRWPSNSEDFLNPQGTRPFFPSTSAPSLPLGQQPEPYRSATPMGPGVTYGSGDFVQGARRIHRVGGYDLSKSYSDLMDGYGSEWRPMPSNPVRSPSPWRSPPPFEQDTYFRRPFSSDGLAYGDERRVRTRWTGHHYNSPHRENFALPDYPGSLSDPVAEAYREADMIMRRRELSENYGRPQERSAWSTSTPESRSPVRQRDNHVHWDHHHNAIHTMENADAPSKVNIMDTIKSLHLESHAAMVKPPTAKTRVSSPARSAPHAAPTNIRSSPASKRTPSPTVPVEPLVQHSASSLPTTQLPSSQPSQLSNLHTSQLSSLHTSQLSSLPTMKPEAKVEMKPEATKVVKPAADKGKPPTRHPNALAPRTMTPMYSTVAKPTPLKPIVKEYSTVTSDSSTVSTTKSSSSKGVRPVPTKSTSPATRQSSTLVRRQSPVATKQTTKTSGSPARKSAPQSFAASSTSSAAASSSLSSSSHAPSISSSQAASSSAASIPLEGTSPSSHPVSPVANHSIAEDTTVSPAPSVPVDITVDATVTVPVEPDAEPPVKEPEAQEPEVQEPVAEPTPHPVPENKLPSTPVAGFPKPPELSIPDDNKTDKHSDIESDVTDGDLDDYYICSRPTTPEYKRPSSVPALHIPVYKSQ